MENAKVKVIDAIGRIVLINENFSGSILRLDMEKFSHGNYIVTIEYSGLIYVDKFFKL